MESRIFNEVQDTKKAFAASTPYLHAVLQDLVQPDLLKEVRKEVLSQLHFTEKETDIYRVYSFHSVTAFRFFNVDYVGVANG